MTTIIINNNLNYNLVSRRKKIIFAPRLKSKHFHKKISFLLIFNPLHALWTGNLYICHIRLEVFAFIMLPYLTVFTNNVLYHLAENDPSISQLKMTGYQVTTVWFSILRWTAIPLNQSVPPSVKELSEDTSTAPHIHRRGIGVL